MVDRLGPAKTWASRTAAAGYLGVSAIGVDRLTSGLTSNGNTARAALEIASGVLFALPALAVNKVRNTQPDRRYIADVSIASALTGLIGVGVLGVAETVATRSPSSIYELAVTAATIGGLALNDKRETRALRRSVQPTQ